MMPAKSRSFRTFRNPIGCLILLAAFAAAAGCSTAESPGGSGSNMNHILPSGSSVDGWLVVPTGGDHAKSATLDYIANGGSSGCAQCHGSDLAEGTGGISNVSCYNDAAGCHHPAGWGSPANHGKAAKAAPESNGSFFSCQICHGTGFRTPLGTSDWNCFTCHPTAPHPRAPWRSTTGSTHTDTNTSNAPVCAQCHRNSNPGTPGCFNNTLCHGAGGVPHPVGNPAWIATPPAPQPHGSGAKATPSSTAGFLYCQVCHGSGTDFAGGSSGTSCYPCHSATSNHPHPTQWRTGDTYVHTSTATGNAAACAYCHRNGANSPIPPPPAPAPGSSPDCFNNTLCHGAGGAPHPVGSTWVAASPAAQPHGNSAKATPGATAGYIYCQTCHGTGTDFAGGSSGKSCYPCHAPTANSPHASQWRTGDTYVHTSTATGNAAACAYCHLNGANSPIAPPSPPAPAGTAPGCFNSTLCHGAGGVPHPVGSTWVATSPAAQPHGNSAKAAPTATTGFSYCQICHGTGTNFAGGSAISCYPCHGANAPHPNQWRTADAYVHTTTATGNASVCAFCHTGGSNSPMPLIPTLNTPAGTSSCYNNTLCHGTDGYHPATWSASNQHGTAAKALPSASTGFAVCQNCHGTGTTSPANFGGGSAEVSCYPCHNLNAPHPDTWIGGGDLHRSTNQAQSNIDVCAQCHRRNPDPNPGEVSGCFNTTLCHN